MLKILELRFYTDVGGYPLGAEHRILRAIINDNEPYDAQIKKYFNRITIMWRNTLPILKCYILIEDSTLKTLRPSDILCWFPKTFQ